MVEGEMTHYALLGVDADATKDEIKLAWRKIAKDTHPDRHADDPERIERFKKCKDAYETLVDPRARVAYDTELRGPNIAAYLGSWVQAHQNEIKRRAAAVKEEERRRAQQKRRPPPSAYAQEQARLEKEFGWTADPSNYASMMGKKEDEDPTAQYDTPLDGLNSDDLLQALLSEAVLKAAMREDRLKVDGNKVEVTLSPDMKVTIDSHTVKNLRKVHKNLKQMERLVTGVKRWWRG